MSQLAAGGSRAASVRWRYELLRIAFAGMEISWFAPFFIITVVAARAWPPLAVGALLLAVELGFYFWSEFAEGRQMSAGVERLVALLALPVLILLGWRIFLFPGIPAGDMAWIPAAFTGLITSQGAGFWAVMATVLFLWWRGLSLSRREFEFEVGGLFLASACCCWWSAPCCWRRRSSARCWPSSFPSSFSA